jgi:ribosomal protein L44E
MFNRKEWMKIYDKGYRETHKKERLIYNRKNAKKINMQQKSWRDRNPNKVEEYNKLKKVYNRKIKSEVLRHYSLDLKCQKCGFDNLDALTIDHINGGGREHRKKIGFGGSFYYWLRRNNYPEGFQVLCMNCQFIKRKKNKECKR